MNKSILVALCFCLLTACGDDSKGTSNNKNGANGQKGAQDQDIATCVGPDEESIDGLWAVTANDGGISFYSTYHFTNGHIYLSNTCVFNEIDLEITAETNSTYVDNGRDIQFLRNNSKTEYYRDEKVEADCTASIKAMTMAYEIKGQCLIFSLNSEKFILRRPKN